MDNDWVAGSSWSPVAATAAAVAAAETYGLMMQKQKLQAVIAAAAELA